MTHLKKRSANPIMLSVMLALPLAGILSDVHFTVRFDDETPGLRFRSEPDSLFHRSATVFETHTGRDTADVLEGAMDFLAERYGLEAACPPVPSVDINNSDFLTGNIVMTDGAWGFYRAEDLAGGPCPTSTLDPRPPALFLETISQIADFDVDLAIGGVPILWTPDVTLVQVLVLPYKPDLPVGGTFLAEHGEYTLNEIAPADLTTPFDDALYGVMVLDWGLFEHQIDFKAIEPNTTTPNGSKRMTLQLQSDLFGTGVFDTVYSAFAIAWDEDPELTGNPIIGVPRNPILTPSRVNFRYVGTATFPYDPTTDVHATCTNDFSDPDRLRICPTGVPQQ